MAYFWNRRPARWDPAAVEPPWGHRPSIYRHIQSRLAEGKALSENGAELPDEERVASRGLRWIAGGRDGAFGHHGGGGSGAHLAAKIHDALGTVLRDATKPKLATLYALLLEESALDFVDPFLERLTSRRDLDPGQLGALAEWLARGTPDREPLKWAIAMLGVVPTPATPNLLMTLGRHEEFTLFVAVAVSNSAPQPEKTLFELAQHVNGWGRIQIVERLAETTDPAIARWLLREGYKNSIMHEYLAYTCATVGGLLFELNADTIDAELLAATGDLLQALIVGGPAQGMDDYEDGPQVVERYLHHLGATPSRLESLLVIDAIRSYVGLDRDWTATRLRGWTDACRATLRTRCEALIALPHWGPAVSSGLEGDNDGAFVLANEGARVLGIDTWDKHFQRLAKADGIAWFAVMRTSDPERVDRVVAYGEQHLPLDRIATGPATELGLGLEWAAHSKLDCILQDLHRFPGKGWTLLRTGLSSPVVRNRHMALRALSAWEKGQWPADAEERLGRALEIEPDGDVREKIHAVLEGKALGPKRVESD